MLKNGRLIIFLCVWTVIAAGILLAVKFQSRSAETRITQQSQPVFKEIAKDAVTETPPPASPTPISRPEPVLTEYKGAIRHIFFHPLILYPEKAFDGDSLSQGYDDWFVTVGEFKKILASLYSKNYMLVDMEKLYEIKQEAGKSSVVKKKLLLPEGKKPLIISVDDINYYDYMRENGNAYKLVIDAGGNVAAYSVTPEGREKIECDNEIVPIIDEFVKKHPDFSLEGAKGILALTGYAGILGYRTQDRDSENYAKEKEEALKVVKRLKETGWSFASHGYGHLHSNKISYDRLKEDTERWKTEVEPLVGPTNIYVYPYGEELPVKGPKFKMLLSEGFNIFCPVGNTGFQLATDSYVQMDRMNIDGFAFRHGKDKLGDMFDVDSVIDNLRPPVK